MKLRLSVYVEPSLAAQLADLAKRKKQSVSLIGEAAIASFLTPDDSDRREAAIVRRLDRIDRRLDRLERDLGVSIEAMGLFIRLWLIVTASVRDDLQELAQAKGRDRFASFLEMLGQRLASGNRLAQEVAADICIDKSATDKLQK